MKLRIFVSRDAGAVAVGADEVALALQQAAGKRGVDIEIVRTGSRGMYWLEPMIEVATPKGRVAFGPVTEADAASVLDAMVSGACASAASGHRRRNTLAEAADPPHLRALRHHRSALDRGLPRP